ncbi:glycoside hydrolase family 88 protein [Pedobacter sp. PAMC26386]|nr:glycoside hydrolase family 88 protein [Pedobacter sp. PAMC26386]
MKLKINLTLAVLLSLTVLVKAQNVNVTKALIPAEKQVNILLEKSEVATAGESKFMAPRTLENGQLKSVIGRDWTSGFFSGMLWYLYDLTKDPKWLDPARKFTQKLAPQQYNTGTHDLGFIIYCSFGNGYRLTGDTSYRSVIIQAAKSLSKRFNPVAGVIRSWDHNADKWQFPVIIDNMMNLELLFEATKLTGDSSFYKIAVSHANTTLKNHFRKDFSSYHVVDYNPETGAVKWRGTAQGLSNSSAWARGQAWALYGYTMCYRETKDKTYLKQAENIAKFILTNPTLPVDKVPFWDFNDPQIPNAPKDASAAAIIASGLYELSGYSKEGKNYRKTADQILNNLSEKYTSNAGANEGFILAHSTGHKPAKSEIDVPIIYADYYYLEALSRSKRGK